MQHQFIALLVAIVGTLGLGSTMSTNVIERTRELGVLRALGATPRIVFGVVISEGLFIGILSWVLALVLTLPLSATLGSVVGSILFRLPFSMAIAPRAAVIWLAVIVCSSALATALPAWRAARLTVREALAHL